MNIDSDFLDDNDDGMSLDRLAQSYERLEDQNCRGLDHIHAAKRDLRREIDVIADVRLGDGALSGRKLDDHLTRLIEIEGDLSRAEGELSD